MDETRKKLVARDSSVAARSGGQRLRAFASYLKREHPSGNDMGTQELSLGETPATACRRGALTIGNFDGVHRGHLALLDSLAKKAQELGGPAVALTFDPHPLQLLRPEQFQPVLTTVSDRAEIMAARGADQVVILRTTPELLQLTARDFFQKVIREQLEARCLVEGENFCFGRNREGTVQSLTQLMQEAGLAPPTIVPAVRFQGTPVSSSRVRSALLNSHVREAATLLDRPYRIRGRVGTGQRRGQKLGFPTANLEQVTTLIPGDGVYAVRAVLDGKVWGGAANVGPNPTFGEGARKVEVHVLDFAGDLYGQVLAVDFVDHLRNVQSFAGVDQLVEQLRADVERARRILEE
jgi:riboflavin kinase/FMN adenylyltransferase